MMPLPVTVGALLLTWTSISFGQSTSSATPQAQPAIAASAATDRLGTRDAPVFVQQVPIAPTQAAVLAEVEERQRTEAATLWTVRGTIATAAFTGLLTLFTVFLWLSTRSSVHVARDALALARESAVRQQRAYVNVVNIYAQWSKEKDILLRRVLVTVQIKNTGQTPAHRSAGWCQALSLPIDATEFPPITEPIGSVGVQAPGQVDRFQFWYQAPHELTDDVLTVWRRGPSCLFVYGELRYVDAFGESRHTRFRYVMPSDGVGEQSGRFKPCASGNESL